MKDKCTQLIPINMGMVNAYLIKGEKTVLVDTGYYGNHNKIMKVMTKHGVKPKDIELIILTHGHNDHFGSVKELKNITGAKVVIHQSDVDNLINGTNGKLIPSRKMGKVLSKFSNDKGNPQKYGIIPDLIIDDEIDLKEYGINGKIILTPGHTLGSISIIVGEDSAIVGDLMMAFLPWEKPKFPLYAEDINLVTQSIKKVIETGVKEIYLSHGKVYKADYIKKLFNIS